ncbi:ribosome maturation factor RimM [Aerococcus urinaehominis]|uniref:Ribosome maturation factor RimM n=2 Tax=Aerococcus urinaehominis TaxID=128944 RepID=A0A109RGK7_9LACT|nr:ribosome maturation factor RimM [Aerococcus urinaehominis]AMB98949.1 ribosome maturation factor RimM [Aerococcus urinaehominis]SDM40905.1 16S rRNA processing protein RimM [Aerococcus urinaehominis]
MELYKVGKIVNTHALKGEVRVIASTDFPDQRFALGSELVVELESGPVKVTVDGHRRHKNFNILHFAGLDSINDVERFKGAILSVAGEHQAELAENEYYYHEIIGLDVYTLEGDQLGKIREITALGPNDVWHVQRKGPGRDILIPYIADVVKDIDLDQGRVTIEVMEGLID